MDMVGADVGGLAMDLGLERAEPPNSPGPTFMVACAVMAGEASGDTVAGGDSDGEGGRGTDVGSGRCDGAQSGSVWRAGIRTAGADQIGIKSGTNNRAPR